MKTLLSALLVLTLTSSTAFAQKRGDETDNTKRLLKQIAELKEVIGKLKGGNVERIEIHRKEVDDKGKADRPRRVEIRVRRADHDEKRIDGNVKGVRFQIRKIHVVKDKDPQAHAAHLKHALERLEHMGAAIKHLQAAGMKDLAAEAMKRAGHFKKEIAAAKNRDKAHSHGEHAHHKHGKHEAKGPNTPNHLREISTAILQLRKQVAGLQKAVERLERRK